ncbi:MAG TPA: LysM peptidoglycan-binding domain-containing protein [Gammaproteobacteria bacterium]|nr:LysM peptidoglycan-binding domain-containing protein [Gammaproteobacteria bacterium]
MKLNILATPILLAAMMMGFVGCASTPEEPAAEATPAVTQADADKAIAAAKASIAEAKKLNSEWTVTDDLMKQAEEAYGAGDYAKAVDLANQAKAMADAAIAQAKSEQARNATASEDASAARKSAAGADQYQVVRGDNLWNIAGKSDIYSDSYQWPLIYKANRDQIKDADLITSGQVLNIDRNASSADVAAAVKHAKTRGAWTLGVTEESDTAYLAQ